MALEMKRWNLFLPPALLADIKRLAAKQKKPASLVLRTAAEKYLLAVAKADAAAKAHATQQATAQAKAVAETGAP